MTAYTKQKISQILVASLLLAQLPPVALAKETINMEGQTYAEYLAEQEENTEEAIPDVIEEETIPTIYEDYKENILLEDVGTLHITWTSETEGAGFLQVKDEGNASIYDGKVDVSYDEETELYQYSHTLTELVSGDYEYRFGILMSEKEQDEILWTAWFGHTLTEGIDLVPEVSTQDDSLLEEEAFTESESILGEDETSNKVEEEPFGSEDLSNRAETNSQTEAPSSTDTATGKPDEEIGSTDSGSSDSTSGTTTDEVIPDNSVSGEATDEGNLGETTTDMVIPDDTTPDDALSDEETGDTNDDDSSIGIGETEDYEYRALVLNVGATKTEVSITWVVDDQEELLKTSELEGLEDKNHHFVEVRVKNTVDSDLSDALVGEYNSNIQSTTYRHTFDVKVNTSYEYRIGDSKNGSEWFELNIGAEDNSYSFIAAGDPQIGASGNTESDGIGWKTTLEKAGSWFSNIDFLLTAGDQVNGSSSGYLEAEYDELLAPDLLKTIPMVVNVGNHEASNYKTSYGSHYTLPNLDSGTVTDNDSQTGDYWFEYEGTLFMSLNSNYSTYSAHIDFMEKAQKEYEVEYGKPTWQIVTFHHSIFSTATHSSSFTSLRNALAVPFSEMNIDVVLMGHDHVYTRSVMMYGEVATTQTDTYGEWLGGYEDYSALSSVTDPKAGEVLYITMNSGSGSKNYSIKDTVFDYVAVRNQENVENITKVDVSDNEISFVTYRTGEDNSKEDIVDEFTIYRTSTKNSYDKDEFSWDKDQVAPIITATEELSVMIGEDFDHTDNVTAKDYDYDSGEYVTLSNYKFSLTPINNTITYNNVPNFEVTGTYEVTYTATDSVGNSSSVKVTYTVKEKNSLLPEVEVWKFSATAGENWNNSTSVSSDWTDTALPLTSEIFSDEGTTFYLVTTFTVTKEDIESISLEVNDYEGVTAYLNGETLAFRTSSSGRPPVTSTHNDLVVPLDHVKDGENILAFSFTMEGTQDETRDITEEVEEITTYFDLTDFSIVKKAPSLEDTEGGIPEEPVETPDTTPDLTPDNNTSDDSDDFEDEDDSDDSSSSGNSSSSSSSSNSSSSSSHSDESTEDEYIEDSTETTNESSLKILTTETTVDEETGDTVTTTIYASGVSSIQTISAETGEISVKVTGVFGETTLVLPIEETLTPSTVAVLVDEDGNRTILADSFLTEIGLQVTVNGSVSLEIIDNVKEFTDVDRDLWFNDAVSFVTARELFSGMTETQFAPNDTMTRSMIWVVLASYRGESFSQMGESWFSNAQTWAISQGISDGTNPDGELTREQLVLTLYRLQGSPVVSNEDFTSFHDSETISTWASTAMAWAVSQGLMGGDDAGNLNPQNNGSRAEVATILMNYIMKL